MAVSISLGNNSLKIPSQQVNEDTSIAIKKYVDDTLEPSFPLSSTFTDLILNRQGGTGQTTITKGWYKIFITGGAESYARFWSSTSGRWSYSGYYGGHGGGFSMANFIDIGLQFYASGGKGQSTNTAGTAGEGIPGYGG
jgi:hypothetical protein